jgi:hypothetical protein
MIETLILSGSAVAALAAAGSVGVALFPPLPRDLGGAPNLDRRARRVRIAVGGDDAIDGWWLPGTRPAAIVLFHGFGRTHHRTWRYAAFLRREGYHLLAVDFRSSRVRSRKPTTLGHYEVSDAEAALDWLLEQPEAGGVRVGFFGESLGASVGLEVAARRREVEAIAVDCPFAHAAWALEDSCERWARLPRQPSVRLLRSIGRRLTGCDPGAADTLSIMPALADRPVFFIHAMEDDRIDPEQTRLLWRAAGGKDPLWLIPGAGHNEGWSRQREAYEERVQCFFARHLLGEGPGLPPGLL